MNVTPTSGCFAVVMIFGAAAPASATPEDCAAIGDAFARMGTVPAFHETIEQDGTSLEAIAVGDKLYMVMGGETTELPLQAGGRAQLFAGLFDAFTVTDCAALPDETIDGRALKVFSYVLPPDGGLIPEAIEQRVWIGIDDGLPYLATNPAGSVTITYEGVVAPTP
ncbi:hypothetical protein [Devosia lacusdianchii]|uniref:hypothetical protein n=1 Tax=Devosia lacusdianchii TaxID=2917991 RepID=UPI001F06DCAA|nr:hypothetical protein [Devosia sp. JXJ CY 41]